MQTIQQQELRRLEGFLQTMFETHQSCPQGRCTRRCRGTEPALKAQFVRMLDKGISEKVVHRFVQRVTNWHTPPA